MEYDLVFAGHDAYGDHFTYNGMIHYLLTKYKKIYYTTSNNRDFLVYMYRNIHRITIMDLRKGFKKNYLRYYTEIFQNTKTKLLVAHKQLYYVNNNNIIKCEHINESDYQNKHNYANGVTFYDCLQFPIEYRYRLFTHIRDMEREKKIYENIANNMSEYIIIHDDENRNIKINRSLLNNHNIININNLSPCLLDLCTLIENSSEIHLVDAAPALMIYYMQLSTNTFCKNKPIYFHAYARNRSYITMFMQPKCDNWIFIDKNGEHLKQFIDWDRNIIEGFD